MKTEKLKQTIKQIMYEFAILFSIILFINMGLFIFTTINPDISSLQNTMNLYLESAKSGNPDTIQTNLLITSMSKDVSNIKYFALIVIVIFLIVYNLFILSYSYFKKRIYKYEFKKFYFKNLIEFSIYPLLILLSYFFNESAMPYYILFITFVFAYINTISNISYKEKQSLRQHYSKLLTLRHSINFIIWFVVMTISFLLSSVVLSIFSIFIPTLIVAYIYLPILAVFILISRNIFIKLTSKKTKIKQVKDKKGQISIFVIFGIIMVMIFAIFFYNVFYTKTTTTNFDNEKLGFEFQAVSDFVEYCLNQVSKEGVVKLGQHGGYIEPENPMLSKKYFEFPTGSRPTEADTVYLNLYDSSSPNQIPYWWYMKSSSDCSDCLFSSNAPTMDSMALQLEEFIIRELPFCIDDFSSFDAQRYSFETEAITPTVTVSQTDVQVELNYPITISLDDSKQNYDNFNIRLPVHLLDVYEVANKIANFQKNQSYFENITRNLISLNSGVDRTKLPPISAVTQNENAVTWMIFDVEKKLKEVLSYMNLIQLNKTNNYKPIVSNDTYTKGVMSSFNIDLLDQYYDLDVSFFYLDWPIHFSLLPNSGFLIEPSSITYEYPALLPTDIYHFYDFFYDVSFPVVVHIRSPNDFNKEGYDFFISLEGNLKRNTFYKEVMEGKAPKGPLLYIDEDTEIVLEAEDFEVPVDIQDTVSQEDYDAHAANATQTIKIEKDFFCDAAQRLSTEVNLIARDFEDGNFLEGVSVTYYCGTYAACPSGNTYQANSISIPKVKTRLPICLNGHLKFQKTGYYTQTMLYNSTDAKDVTVLLKPLHIINFSVKKVAFQRKLIPSIIDSTQGFYDDTFSNPSTLKLYSSTSNINDMTKLYSSFNEVSNTIIKSDNTCYHLIPDKYNDDYSYIKRCNQSMMNSRTPSPYVFIKNNYQLSSTCGESQTPCLTPTFYFTNINLYSEIIELNQTVQNITYPETFSVMFEKTTTGIDDPFVRAITDEQTEIELVAGDYKLNGNLINEEGYLIYSDKRYYEYNGNREIIYMPGQEDPEDYLLQPGIAGGLQIDEDTGLFTITAQDFKEIDHIELIMLELVPPFVMEDTSEMSKLGEYTKEYRLIVNPKKIFK